MNLYDEHHLRFLHTRVSKGEYLTSGDIDFILKVKGELKKSQELVEEILERQIQKEEMC